MILYLTLLNEKILAVVKFNPKLKQKKKKYIYIIIRTYRCRFFKLQVPLIGIVIYCSVQYLSQNICGHKI